MKPTISKEDIENLYPDVMVCYGFEDYDYKVINFGKCRIAGRYSIFSTDSYDIILSSPDRDALENCWNFIWNEGMLLFV